MENLIEKTFIERDKEISLERLCGGVEYENEFHFLNDVIEAYKVLFKIVQPIIAEVDIFGSNKEDQQNKVEYYVENRGFRLKNLIIPDYVEPRFNLGSAIESKTERISPEILKKWIGKCINQKSSDPDKYLVSWENLSFVSSKAKLPKGFNKNQIIVLNEDNYQFEMKTEKEEDGMWLYGPTTDNNIWPPIQIEFCREYWALSLTLKIANSIWFEKGSEGRKMVVDVVNELREIGWDLTYASSEFSPELLVVEDED